MASSSTDLKPESSTSPEQEPSKSIRTLRSVLLCGASVRSLAESAIAAGLRPLCVDFFEDADLKRLLANGRGRFVARIATFMQLPPVTHAVRSSIPMIWAGGLENYPDVLRAVAARRPVIGASADLTGRLRNPEKFRQWLTEAELNCPDLASVSSASPHCEWLRKPVAGSGGFGIHTLRDPSSLFSDGRLPLPAEEYLQEYIDGVPMSATFSSDGRSGTLIGTSLQLVGWPVLGASDFLYCGNTGPVDPGDDVSAQVCRAADVLVAHTGLKGVFGIDFVLRQGRAWFLEVNPRLTASHMLYDHVSPAEVVSNLLTRHLEAYGWRSGSPKRHPQRIEPPATANGAAARLVLWASENFTVPPDFSFKFISCDGFAAMADIPECGTLVPAGSPVCSVHVQASSLTHLVQTIASLRTPDHGSKPWSWPQLCSWADISQQLQILIHRFERNRYSSTPPPTSEAQGMF